MHPKNLTLLTDFYELTMMQGYFETGKMDEISVFDLYHRKNPCGSGYAVASGLEQAIEFIKNLEFTDSDIAYLQKLRLFSDDFLQYLKNFKFSGDIYAIPEGTVVFPNEPLMRVKAPILEAQLLETALLNIINHQSLIATKAARVVYAAKEDKVLEFGLRRAQGPDAGLYGARAALIGGCSATSNVLAGQIFNVPISGTHAHSWVMSFEDELTAFREYANIFPNDAILLVDTYDTLHSGVPNAIKVFQEMKDEGIQSKNYGIRLDSGDLAYLSKQARKMLDAAGFEDAIISASSDLDEYLIESLKQQGAQISMWGVGTNLITSSDCPAFGGVYKLVATAKGADKELIPTIKVSENPEKITNPGMKKVIRLYDSHTHKIKADLICLDHETVDPKKALTIFDPINTWKQMTLEPQTFYTKELLVPIFKNGKLVYTSPSVMEIREFHKEQMDTIWDEYKRLTMPNVMKVDLSLELYNLKQQLIAKSLGNPVPIPFSL